MAIVTGPVKSWSYSRLIDFETCPYRAELKYVNKIPEEKAEAAERGTQIHQLAEDYVSGKLPDFPLELIHFAEEFAKLKDKYKAGEVSLEGEWGFNQNWLISTYKDAWVRIKLDARYAMTKKHSVVVDYKTGKKSGNEVKHGEQVLLYGLAELLRQPEVESVTVELWYLDINELVSLTYTREELLRYLPSFEKRGIKLTTATKFPATPNTFSCKWCAYGPNKGNQCNYGVSTLSNPISDYRKRFK